jgi:hypothetical protein
LPLLSRRQRVTPTVFATGGSHAYQVARCLPDRHALVTETDLVSAIEQSQRTFDVLAVTGTSFYVNTEVLSEAVRRGVRFRFLLMDHSESNRANVETYFRFCGSHGGGIDASTSTSKLAEATLRRLQTENSQTGKIELRWWRGPFINSFWIRDAGEVRSGMGHLEITFFGDQMLNPSVRFGNLSPGLIVSLQQQFEYLWERSSPADGANGLKPAP